MNVAVIGTGYVGLVSGACMAELGHQVTCVDIDEKKIQGLREGVIPIYEPGLEELVKRNVALGRLRFSTDYAEALDGVEVISIAVGTPSSDDGSVDMRYVDGAAHAIGRYLKRYAVIADKSTVPVGTAERVREIIREETNIECDVVSNPETLREGKAVYDFLHPSRVIIDSSSSRATDVMMHLFAYLDCPKVITDSRSAELTKYAANSFLATKISFINEMSALCEELGADVEAVAKGMGLDPRIGKDFLRAGLGWGGSCFPKDVKALVKLGESLSCAVPIVKAAIETNNATRTRLVNRLEKVLSSCADKKICILGLAFKDNTDDTRESAALAILQELTIRGAHISVYDPVARLPLECQTLFITQHNDPYEAAQVADAVVIATEWDEFRMPDITRLKSSMKGHVLFDARNLLRHEDAEQAGFTYLRVGKK